MPQQLTPLANALALCLGYGGSRETHADEKMFSDSYFSVDFSHQLTPYRDQGDGYIFDADSDGAQHTHTDHENVTRAIKAEECRCQGSRRIENLISGASNDFTVKPWGTLGFPTIVDEHTITYTSDPTDTVFNPYFENIAGKKVRISADIELVSGNGDLRLDVRSTIGAGTSGSVDITVDSTRRRYSALITVNATFTLGCSFGLRNGSTGIAGTVKVYDIQMELVEYQSNQNPSEYIGVGDGVLLNPERLQVVDTSANGAINADLEWISSAFAINTPGVLTNLSAYQTVYSSAYAKKNTLYQIIWTYTHTNNLLAVIGPSGTALPSGYLTPGDHSVYVRSGATTTARVISFVAGGVIGGQITNLKIVEVTDYGANVDGVKYSDLANGITMSGNIVVPGRGKRIQPSIRKGLLIEETRTQRIRAQNHHPTATTGISVAGLGAPAGSLSLVTDADWIDGQVFELDNSGGTAMEYVVVAAGIVTAGSADTISAWVKLDGGSGQLIDSAASATPLNFTNTKWERVSLTFTNASGGSTLALGVSAGQKLRFILMQQEKGTNPTSVIVSSTTADITRDADTLAYSAANYPGECTIIFEVEMTVTRTTFGTNRYLFVFDDGSLTMTSDDITLLISSAGIVLLMVYDGTSLTKMVSAGPNLLKKGRYKFAVRLFAGTGENCLFCNGVAYPLAIDGAGIPGAADIDVFHIGHFAGVGGLNNSLLHFRIDPPMTEAEALEASR